MICECGCHDRVIRTRQEPDSVVRTRRCINCGKTMETVERRVEEEEPFSMTRRVDPPKPKRKKKKADPATDEAPESANDAPPRGALEKALANAK